MSVQNVKRGDVVRTREEFEALPVGSAVVTMEAQIYERYGPGALTPLPSFPALVRVVGPVEPEWLEASTVALRRAFDLNGDWGDAAKAAVAAADKARGIVNTREELDTLLADGPVGRRVVIDGYNLLPEPGDDFPVVVRFRSTGGAE